MGIAAARLMLGCAASMTLRGQVRHLDRRLMSRSLRMRSPALDSSLVAITQAANYSRLWLLIAGALAMFGGRKGRKAAGRGLIAIAIAAAVANVPAKLLVRRRRPAASSRPALIRMPRSTSFPSGHSAAAFAFTTGVCAELPELAPALVPLASAVAYSRVHTGVHYPSDVAAGAAIGIGSGALAGRVSSVSIRALRLADNFVVGQARRLPTEAGDERHHRDDGQARSARQGR